MTRIVQFWSFDPIRHQPLLASLPEIAPYGDTAGLIGIVQVVVGQPETVMPGTEGPVPIFVFGALSAVEFHDPVTAEFLHVAFRRARRSQGVVHLDEIGLFSEHIQLELFLGSEKRNQMVEAVDFIASEHQFVILEQIDAVLINIDLQQGVVRMYGQFIVIRECYDVISEFPVGFIGLGGPILAFVQDALHTRMRVEVGPFPTKCRVFPSPLVGIENVRAAEWFGFAEIVYGAYTCHKDCQKSDQYECNDGFAQCGQDLSQQGNQGSFIGTQGFFHK